jgi:hypothetical protein
MWHRSAAPLRSVAVTEKARAYLMVRTFVLALLAASILGGAAASSAEQAIQQTPGSHIAILNCYPHQHAPGTSHPWIDPYGGQHSSGIFPNDEGFLGIDFQNDAKTTMTEIDFGLVVRDTLVATAKDIGTFSPGIAIKHEFVISREVFPIGTAYPYCAVLRVKYSDRSEWHNPNPPPSS